MTEIAVEQRIAASVGAVSISFNRATSKRVEAAMSRAVTDCHAEGMTDDAQIRSRMLAAREQVK